MGPVLPYLAVNLEALQHPPGPTGGLLAVAHHPQGAQRGGHLRQHRAARVEGGGGVLGHVLHRPPEGPQRSGSASAHGFAVEQDLAGVFRPRGVEQQQGAQQRRLAAS